MQGGEPDATQLTALAVGTILIGTAALAASAVAAQEDCGFGCLGIRSTDDVPLTEDIVGPITDAVLEPGLNNDLYLITTDPDGDGLTDDVERNYGTDPYVPDTDGDSLFDGQEITYDGTDPLNPDTDGDGLIDEEEVSYTGTDPLDHDTDDDGVDDLTEYRSGTNPRDPSSF